MTAPLIDNLSVMCDILYAKLYLALKIGIRNGQ